MNTGGERHEAYRAVRSSAEGVQGAVGAAGRREGGGEQDLRPDEGAEADARRGDDTAQGSHHGQV